MPPPSTPEIPLEFSEQQDQVVLGLAANIKTAALVTLTLGVVSLFTGLILWFWWGEAFLAGLFALVFGGVNKLLGLILLSTSTDARYIAETKGHDKIHLLNAVTSINLWLQIQIGLGILVGIVLLFRLFM